MDEVLLFFIWRKYKTELCKNNRTDIFQDYFFELLSPFFETYCPHFSWKLSRHLCLSKRAVWSLQGKCIKVPFCSFHFWDLIFWTLFVATTGLVRRRWYRARVSRRQTKGDFLRASAPLARGRWWEWQIAENFRCALRIAGEIAEKCSRRDRGGEDFESDAYLWDYLPRECKKSLRHKLDMFRL